MTGGSLQLMLLMGKMVAVPAPAILTDALQSVQVTTSSDAASGFQLTLSVSKNSPITRVLLPTGLLDPKTRVIVMAVVSGLPHVLMDGVITRHELDPGQAPGSATLTLTGEDLSLLMRLEHRRESYDGLPRQLQVAMVCARYAEYGIIPAPVPPVIEELPLPDCAAPVQTQTDLDYLKGLAQRSGYVFFIEPGPLPGANIAYWGPEVRTGVPQPALTVNSDAATNVESLRFAYDGLSATEYTIDVTLPVIKTTVGVPVPDVSLLRPPLAVRPAPAFTTKPLPDLTGRSLPDKLLLGLSRTAESRDSVTAQGGLDVLRYGHVLKARQLVGVRGAGPAHDGLYYVRSVTHEIKRGEYRQSFSLVREGFVSSTPVVIP
ncbi:hypothetical protein IPZ58_09550 [Streptomyces roseoverticillatus]|uniref:hypothetical protein n=1 Tax=Streptomyces roseoverticillatus TaxID=66429 RepID=UPI001F1E0461|nr:hypothetical protein [Streptomyces roseoverticillatus]MCF3101826.1 hypothetical protein [Streptomyces roseoverticillatus]